MPRILAVLAFVVLAAPSPAGEIFVASYNVENLFHPTLNPIVGDDDPEFTPTGNKHWDDARLARKIQNLAAVIKSMNNGAGPDILGLSEFENRDVVKMLAQAITQTGRDYQIVHQDSPSERGIDCAIVYDRAKLKLDFAGFHAMPPLKTRDIVEARFLAGDKPLTVFMNHWPSQRHPPADRERAAKVLRKRINQLLADDPQADFLAIGDFNDRESADSLLTHLGAVNTASALAPGKLFNTMAPIAQTANRGTYVYQNQWQTIDHVLISPGLLDPAGFKWKDGSTKDYRDGPNQIYVPTTAGQIPRPNRSYTGSNFHEKGISDHLPVTCVLVF